MLSVVIPFHNEEKNVKRTIETVTTVFKKYKLKGEIIAVDDRSSDATGKILDSLVQRNKLLKVIHRTGGKGVEIGYAIRDGINIAKCEVIAIMMGDLSDDPEDMVKMIKKIEEGYDVVCGSRFIEGAHLYYYPPLKQEAHRTYNTFFSFLFGLKLKDFSNAFKMFRREILKKVEIESKGFEVTAEMLLKAHLLGAKITEVPVKWFGRKSGESKLGSFSFSLSFLTIKLPKIGWRYGVLALKLYFQFLFRKIGSIFKG